MRDKDKTKQQLIDELTAMRQRLARVVSTRTKQKKAKTPLAVSEDYQKLFESSPTGIVVADMLGIIRACNPAVYEKTGYSKDDFVGKHFSKVMTIEVRDIPKFVKIFADLVRGKVPKPFEVRYTRKDGTAGWVEAYIDLVKFSGRKRYIEVVQVDITERKKMEEELQEAELKYRIVADNTYDWEWWLSPAGEFIYISPSCSRITGYSASEFRDNAELFRSIIHPATLPFWDNHRCETSQGEVSPAIELCILHKDGSERWIEHICQPLFDDTGKYHGSRGSNRDITDRKQAEEALRESEEKYRNLVERASDGICIIQDGLVKYANLQQAEMWGGAVEEIIDTPFINYVYHDEIPRLVEFYNRRMAGEQMPSVYEASLVRKDGSRADAELNIGLISYLGKPAELVITRDITERKQAEEALRESEENFRNSLDDSPLGARIVTSEGKTLYANKAILDIYGYSSLEELRAAPTRQRYTPQSYVAHVERREKRKAGEYVPSTYEISIVRKDGEVRVLQVFRKTVKWAGKEQFQVIYQDITEHRQLEEERRRIERLESLGTLAGGIAHDFNNLLTGIMGNISLVRGYVEQGGRAAERLHEAEEAAVRAKDLTQRLLTFARGGEPIKETTAIGRLISDSASFALMGSKSSCVVDFPENLWQVEIDRGQMNEVIHNLVINADEAMPVGGVINISARNRVLREGNALSLPKGDYIEISVEDRGVGIPEDDLPRIFEPYFTTKEKGSGLGLATTYSIIQNHKGHITVDSVPGEHTTFNIYLPATRRSSTSPEEETEDIQVPVTGKILIMDDEESIRRLLQRALSEAGHDIAIAVDGADAIEQYVKANEEGHPFDLVILDLTVPGGMGGVEAMEKLLEIDPKVKAIVSSGYSTDSIMADYNKYGFAAVIAKPYRVRELRRLIRDILQERCR